MNFNQVLLIVNPISGDVDKRQIIQKIRDYAQQIQVQIHFYATTGEQDFENIRSRLDSHDIDRIIAIGGDGTITLVAGAIQHYRLPLAIIPAGSANGLATNFGISDNLEDQIQIAFGSNIFEMDMLRINEDICLHLGDLGINAELIENYENAELRGKFGYLLQSIPTLIKSKYPFGFEIQINGKNHKTSGALLAIANANKYGTGANINPLGSMNDGNFEIILFKKLALGEIIKTISNEIDLDSDVIEVYQGNKAKIFCENPVALQVDGESKGSKVEVEVHVLQEKLMVVVPAKFSTTN